MTDEEAQRAMEEGTPVVVDYALRTVIGTVVGQSGTYPSGRVSWLIRGEGVETHRHATWLRLATAEELLVEGDE